MTDWLVRHFVRDYDNVRSPEVRERYGLLANVVCIVLNVALSIAKGLVGFAVGSVAVVADAANNLSDSFSNVVSMLGFKLASRPPDEHHPYGHGRYEYLASLAVSIVIILIGTDLVESSFGRVLHPNELTIEPYLYMVLVASVAVKLWMSAFTREMGRRIESESLEATSVDSRNDVLATGAVLVSALISSFTGLMLDGWMGLAVGVFVAWSGISLVHETVSMLLGHAPDPALVERVSKRIATEPEVLGVHDLMIHDYGPGRQFASAHVEVAPDISLTALHERLDNIERDLLKDEGLVITLHPDPFERHAEDAPVSYQAEAAKKGSKKQGA